MTALHLPTFPAVLLTCVAWAHAAETSGSRGALALPVAGAVEAVVDFGPALPISAVAFSPDGKLLAVGGYREVLLWDLRSAELARRIGAGQIEGMVHAVAFLDQGRRLAVGDGVPHQSGAVRVFDVATGSVAATLDEPKRVVLCLAVSPDGELLVAGDADSKVHLFGSADAKPIRTLDDHNGRVLGLAFSGDGKRMATASADRTLRVWEVGTWKPVIRYELEDTVHGAAMDADGKYVVGAVGGPEQWAVAVGNIESDLKLAARRKPRARTYSTGTAMPLDVFWPAKGSYLFVPCSDGTVRAYQGASTRVRASLRGHTDWVYCATSTADGRLIATAGADGTVRLWEGIKGEPLATLVQLAPQTEQWIIVTTQGHFAASSPEKVAWRKTDGSQAPAGLTERFHQPEEVGKALAGAIPGAAAKKPAAKRAARGPAKKPGKRPPRKTAAKKAKKK